MNDETTSLISKGDAKTRKKPQVVSVAERNSEKAKKARLADKK